MSLVATPPPLLAPEEATPDLSRTIVIGECHEHPAQMRTLYNLAEMAELTLQVYTHGLDSWQPLLVTLMPEGTGYYLISGHRRRMARLFALALDKWVQHPQSGLSPEEPLTLEQVQTFLSLLLEKYERLEHAAEALAQQFAEQPLPVLLFHGSEKEQILALQRANYGREAPDMLGIAHSFQAALGAGATMAEIARNAGQSVSYVTNHLALTGLPQELAEQIALGALPLTVGVAVAELTHQDQQNGLACFLLSLLASTPETITVKAVKETVGKLKHWQGFQLPLDAPDQRSRNLARALVRLWEQVVQAYPIQSWAVACSFLYQGHPHQAPWEDLAVATAWFQALAGERYVDAQGLRWHTLAEELLPEISCQHCPLAQLPLPPLQDDLPHLPCRAGQSVARCAHGFTPQDPFHLAVPWSWAAHPGVQAHAGNYLVDTPEALLTAWRAQAAAEAEDSDPEPEAERSPAPAPLPPTEDGDHAAPHTASPAVAATPAVATPSPDVPTASQAGPIQAMRQRVAAYMQSHSSLDTAHPFATPCARCRHHLPGSPTKDPNVPPCAWAARLHQVEFKQLQPDQGAALPICRQFAPSQPWRELIPAHPSPGHLPRAWLTHQILSLVEATHSHLSARAPFEFLTGRPLKSGESYRDWFRTQFEAQVGDLSDAQLMTLLTWALAEWQRLRGRPFLLPTRSSGQFLPVTESAWTPTLAEAAHE